MLHAALSENSEVLSGLLAALKAMAVDNRVTVGSMCSGWGVAEMVVDSLNDSLEHFFPGQAPKAG